MTGHIKVLLIATDDMRLGESEKTVRYQVFVNTVSYHLRVATPCMDDSITDMDR